MRINEIFYSIQGEGFYTGKPAVFIRFAGCNLKCPFCDTDFKEYTEMTEDEIINEINKYPSCHVILTGGEPTLQITQSFIDKLHGNHKYIMIETNGTNEINYNIDWITCSPKNLYTKSRIKLTEASEVKVVMDDKINEEDLLSLEDSIISLNYYIQPCDTRDKERNKKIIERCINFIKAHPIWSLSLQTQKILNVR